MIDEKVKIEVKKTSGGMKTIFTVLISLLLGAAVIFGLAKQKPEFLGLPKDAAQVQAEVDVLVAEVDRLIALPTDEKPTVATITDVDKLKDQNFFKNAVNGDKVLIYTNARKAILYRPSENRIIEVGAVNISQASPGPSPATEVQPTEPVTSPQPSAAPNE